MYDKIFLPLGFSMWRGNIFLLSRFCCQCPVTYTGSQVIPSRFFITLNFFILFLIVVAVFLNYIAPPNAPEAVLHIALQLCAYSFRAAIVSIILSPVIYRKTICLVFNMIDDVDNSLKQLGVFPDLKIPVKLASITVTMLCVFKSVLLAVEIYFISYWNASMLAFALYHIVCYYFAFFLMHFFYIMCHLKARYEVLNNALEKLKQSAVCIDITALAHLLLFSYRLLWVVNQPMLLRSIFWLFRKLI